ncbi:MAG: ankyrin repeat domain-containing protein [Synergistaceae bacterium]|nr:ankyrin repeat domain-containing protein [Synergistaceae bacterium]
MLDKEEQQEMFNVLITTIYRETGTEAVNRIKAAIADGFPIDYADKYGLTLLHGAANWNKPECCRTLIELGADINLRDKWGHNSFSRACSQGHIDCAKILIDAGAGWTTPDNSTELPNPMDLLELRKGKAVRDELMEYIKERYSQLRGVSAEDEPAYQQEL